MKPQPKPKRRRPVDKASTTVARVRTEALWRELDDRLAREKLKADGRMR